MGGSLAISDSILLAFMVVEAHSLALGVGIYHMPQTLDG